MTEDFHDVLNAVIPAVPVPFRSDGTIDGEAQRSYVEWMGGQDIGGVAVWAHTGRGPHLSRDQRMGVLTAWREGLPHTRIVCGVGPPHAARLPESANDRHRAVLEMTRASAMHARDGGADVLLAHPPRILSALPSAANRMVEYHAALSESGLPVLAFLLYEAAGGVWYDQATLREILSLDGVIGVKIATLDSIMTFQDVTRSLSDLPDVAIISGEDRFLGYSLMCGARGVLVGLGAACTDLVVALFRAWKEGRYGDFVDLAARIDRFAEATFRAPMEGYVQRMLWALEADGVLPRAAVDPFGPPLDDADQRIVREACRALRA